MRMARPELVLLFAALSFSTACGAKGDDDDGDDDTAGTGGTGPGSGGTSGSGSGGDTSSGGTAGRGGGDTSAGGTSGGSASGGAGGTGGSAKMTLFAFENEEAAKVCAPPVTGDQSSCFSFQNYRPSDANYVNVFANPDPEDEEKYPDGTEDSAYTEDLAAAQVLRAESLDWSDEPGDDEAPGVLELDIPFSDKNQLADIQFNFSGEMAGSDWSGKVLRADIMIEEGCSPDPSAPCGAYLFVKTGADYVWAKGTDANLGAGTYGVWQTVSFNLDLPAQNNDGYSASEIVSFGLQVYSGPGGTEPATDAVIYVDNFSIE